MKIQKRHIVLAALILALGSAVYLNWQFSDPEKMLKSNTSKELGAATYVNADATSDQVAHVSNQTTSTQEYFSKAEVEREQARDEALEIAQETVKNADSSDEAKTVAVQQLSELENNIVKESNIESILKAKGFSQCLCYISDKSCSISVPKKELQKNSPLIIKDAVLSQIDISFNNITIIEV